MEEWILTLAVLFIIYLVVFAVSKEIRQYRNKFKTVETVQSKTVNLDAESQKIKSAFNGVMLSLALIIFVQGAGFSASIGSVLQENFGISQFVSFFVVLTISLPLILILRGMQIMTNAILLNKANK